MTFLNFAPSRPANPRHHQLESEMFTEHRFDGGRIVPREKGEMFDQKTGKKTTWEKGVKLLGESKPITLTKVQLLNIDQLLQNEEFLEWLNDGK